MSLKRLLSREASIKFIPRTMSLLCLAIMQGALAATALAQGLPNGGNVTHGQAVIHSAGNTMQIHQNSANAVIDWNSFNIDNGHSVNFQVPTGGATLNQIAGAASQINGNLNSNGTLYLLNPNGILFGKGASVNVGSLVATTSALSADNFMNGNRTFTGEGKGKIGNAGTIIAATGGSVVLAGAGMISNTGTIVVPEGSIQMVSGDKFTLSMATQNPFLSVTLDATATGAQVENMGGTLRAGSINLQAVRRVVSTGTVEASSLADLKGAVNFSADAVVVNGKVTSQGDITIGGKDTVQITGAHLSAENDIKATANGFLSVFDSTLRTADGSIALTSDARLAVRGSNLEANAGDIELRGVGHGTQFHKHLTGVLIEDSTLKATSPDVAKGRIRVKADAHADRGAYERGAAFVGSTLTGNGIDIYGHGQSGVFFHGGTMLHAEHITISGTGEGFGPNTLGVTFAGSNQLTADKTLNITGQGGVAGVLFSDSHTLVNSPQSLVSGNTLQPGIPSGVGIKFTGQVAFQSGDPDASTTFLSDGYAVTPPTI
ncbi:filamentous hemagglutinin N-terminal domain-containing protein [Pseudomonas sp. D47]|uniref:two-partner secretion domain-containing protein n=1 Tax=Pseudomonas sp. D47 TaxID=3159447 RepID=UPI00387B1D1D